MSENLDFGGGCIMGGVIFLGVSENFLGKWKIA